jgi:hypothetical protein
MTEPAGNWVLAGACAEPESTSSAATIEGAKKEGSDFIRLVVSSLRAVRTIQH